jgi:hypothetical protein
MNLRKMAHKFSHTDDSIHLYQSLGIKNQGFLMFTEVVGFSIGTYVHNVKK